MPGRHRSLIAICGMNEQRNSATRLTFSGSQFFPLFKTTETIDKNLHFCLARSLSQMIQERALWSVEWGSALKRQRSEWQQPSTCDLSQDISVLGALFSPVHRIKWGQSLILFPAQTKVFRQFATILLCKIPFYEETFTKFQEISKKNRIHWFF